MIAQLKRKTSQFRMQVKVSHEQGLLEALHGSIQYQRLLLTAYTTG